MSSLSIAVQSSLLTLPSECRSVVFQHVFGEVAVQAYNIGNTFKMNVSGQPQISLLRVSRQVYYEAEDALADSMILFVNITNNGIRLASSMTPGLVARLRHVQVLTMRPNTLSGMPNLQVVNIKNPSGDITTIGHAETEIQKLREACTTSSRYSYKTNDMPSLTLPAGCKVYRILPSFYNHCHVCDTNMGMTSTYSSNDFKLLSRQYFTVRKGRRVNFDSADDAVNHFQEKSQACVKKRGRWPLAISQWTEEDDE